MVPEEPARVKVPLIDLNAQYRGIQSEIDGAIQRVLDRGQFILGPEVQALEQELAAYCGTRYAVTVANGTDAIELALRAAGIGPGDEVITTSFSFFATAEAILTVGAEPVFADIDPVTYAIDPSQVESSVTAKTRALLPVHLYGHPCDMDALGRIARQHKLIMVEDCAQAIGAAYKGKRVGGFGVAGCFSFYPSKNLGAYGDGGAVVTDDAALADHIRVLRVHGSRKKYHHESVGRNSRLDELQAGILRVKLPHLDEWNKLRRRHAETYRRCLKQAGLGNIGLPQERPGCDHVYHLFNVRIPERDRIYSELSQRGIGVQIAYPSTLPQQPVFGTSRSFRSCPHAESVARDILSLPLYPELTEELINRVVQELKALLR